MTTETWERKIGLADTHGTVLTVGYEPPEDDEHLPYASVQFSTGAADLICDPTSDALRQAAAAFLDLAEAIDAAGLEEGAR